MAERGATPGRGGGGGGGGECDWRGGVDLDAAERVLDGAGQRLVPHHLRSGARACG